MDNMFSNFPETTYELWKLQLSKDLKGISVDQLIKTSLEGAVIEPYYVKENSGKPSNYFNHNGWELCEHIVVKDEKTANLKALEALKGGATGLCFYIHHKIDIKKLIANISLEHIYSQFFITSDAIHVIEDLKPWLGKTNIYDGKQKCFVLLDVLGLFAFYGEWHANQEADLGSTLNHTSININADLYRNSGANTINELAITLTHLNEYLHYFNINNQLDNPKTIHLSCAVSGDFFMEVAKLRAYRSLIALLLKQYDCNFDLHIHANTAQLNKSKKDAYTNLLRSTTESMSAVIGGCNSLTVLPYNIGFGESNSFSERIARNQQHLLKEESYLEKVNDISKGSYFIETLTEQLAEKAWDTFKTLESKGGFIKGIESGLIQSIIDSDREQLISDFKQEKRVLVGVNKFKNPTEKVVPEKKEHKSNPTKFKAIQPIRLDDYLD
jgi:methylmalonyl-CoA mutase